jgi:HEPN domain-containing protein
LKAIFYSRWQSIVRLKSKQLKNIINTAVMYYLLTESFKSQEAKLIAMITEAVPVEKIYMLGSSLQQQRTESINMTHAPSCRKVGYYWLQVLVDKDCGHSDIYVQDKIENNCQHFVPVTVIVLHTEQFNNWLSEGHRFACTEIKIAVMLHNSNHTTLATPNAINEEADKKMTEVYCTQGINKVNEFIAGAELHRIREQNKMAAFMLHQATEQALLTILKKATALHTNTHNIDRLLRYCSMVNYQMPAIFPRNNYTNERLFQLLQKAYLDSRYKEGFKINSNDLLNIMERVKQLQQMTDTLLSQ